MSASTLQQVPLIHQLRALKEEIPHMIKRQEFRAKGGKVDWGVAAPQIRRLKDAQKTVEQLLAEMEQAEAPLSQGMSELKRQIAEQQARERAAQAVQGKA